MKDRDSVHDFVKLEYAGLLAPRTKSASRLRFFLTGLVGSRVEIDEFVGTWLTLDESERSRLGVGCGLGTDCMLGSSAFSVSDKFRIRVYARDFAITSSSCPARRSPSRSPTQCSLMSGTSSIGISNSPFPPAKCGRRG